MLRSRGNSASAADAWLCNDRQVLELAIDFAPIAVTQFGKTWPSTGPTTPQQAAVTSGAAARASALEDVPNRGTQQDPAHKLFMYILDPRNNTYSTTSKKSRQAPG